MFGRSAVDCDDFGPTDFDAFRPARSHQHRPSHAAYPDPGPGAHLAVFDDLDPAVRRADIDAWRDGVARLSRSWAQPLLVALNRGAVSRVVIEDERGNRFTAPAGGLPRWWRRDGLGVRIAGTRGQVP